MTEPDYVDIVFDGPPEHTTGRFVEVEDSTGRSIRYGRWVHRPDRMWALRIDRVPQPQSTVADDHPSPELRERVLADYDNAHPDPTKLYGHPDGRLAHYAARVDAAHGSDPNPWVVYERLPFAYGSTGRRSELPDGFVELVPITDVDEQRARAEAAESDLASCLDE